MLRTIHPTWIAFGWFIAAAVTAFILLAFAAWDAAPVGADFPLGGGAAACFAGFLIGGFFAGWRARGAPVLHGVGIALCSLVIAIIANLAFGEPLKQTAWPPVGELMLLLGVQLIAAVLGAYSAIRWRRGAGVSG